MKKILYIVLSYCILSCGSSNSTSNNSQLTNSILDFHTTDLISLTVPVIYEGKIKYLKNDKTMESVIVDHVPHDNTILNSLSDILSSVTIYKTNKEGTLKLLGNSLSEKNKTDRVLYDFTQTQTIQEGVENDSIKKAIGIAVRMITVITPKKKILVVV